MKTFGVKTMLAGAIVVLSFLGALLYIDNNMAMAIILPTIIGTTQLFNTPIVRISKTTFSVSTPNPFYKNIYVNTADIHKITVDASSYNIRYTVLLNNGNTISTRTGYYSTDLRPLYEALQETGITVEGHGYRTTDWA